ncbi:MAG: NADH-quinone oxidoreductase subunit H [Candidatus Omnitrophica bacterium]|nr:NADH-quinone oxidoreductase subunit H [Candidatus Omnitrophota bacterium]MBU2251050.1 NADH-quinone oxidoreductase subunit H [Candidatus Omnitrophota bacterium]MBU2266399.1 NADH-quinone oxidoreductase subunit H [Candidatus Omnitrophota bacterium]MBU2473602.1 NADH-quinone oxidoreductase subunit H [Candidatus Omnitrophota bacterium]
MIYLIYLIIFGFFLTALIGLFASWVDRKVTARVQYRVGPPVLQPLIDLVKLLGKETMVPKGASKFSFLAAPLLGLGSVILVSTILWFNCLNPQRTFIGDIIVVVYLLVLPSLSIIIGGFASANPLASIGSSREMKLVLSYELPFLLAILVPVIQGGFTLRLGEILTYQVQNGVILGSWSGFLAFLVILMCVQAKLALVPFDIPEAETEIVGGPLIEYSGTPLAVYKLMKNMLLFVLPFFIMILFMGGFRLSGAHWINGILKYLGLVALITVIRNTNPRVRIDQAMRFFWGPMTILAMMAVFLALKGL